MTGALPWDPRVTAWLDRVQAAWVAAGLGPDVCGEMRARLFEDLVSALEDGAPVDQLVAADPGSFARDVAAAAGHAVPPVDATPSTLMPRWPLLTEVEARLAELSERSRFVLAALAGAVAGAALGMLTVFPVGTWAIDAYGGSLGYRGEGLLALVVWAIVSLVSAGLAGVSVRRQFRGSAYRRRLAWSATLGLLISGAAVTLPTMTLARNLGYPSAVVVSTGAGVQPGLVLLEVALVLLALVLGLLAAGELTWRRPAGRPG